MFDDGETVLAGVADASEGVGDSQSLILRARQANCEQSGWCQTKMQGMMSTTTGRCGSRDMPIAEAYPERPAAAEVYRRR